MYSLNQIHPVDFTTSNLSRLRFVDLPFTIFIHTHMGGSDGRKRERRSLTILYRDEEGFMTGRRDRVLNTVYVEFMTVPLP